MKSTNSKLITQRGIFLLPSLFTSAGLFAGFFGVVSAINANYEIAAISVFIAMVMDGLDGRIARLTNTETAFGAEYDSLSDMVSFGMAPALIAFVWSLHSLGKVGWFGAFLYVAAAALRLARFNTQLSSADKRYFQGLSSPAAAGVVVGLIWSATDLGFSGTDISWLSLPIIVFSGILMVSNVRYSSFKEINLKDKVPFVFISIVVLIVAIISIRPALLLFLIFFIYALSGPVLTLVKIKDKRKKASK